MMRRPPREMLAVLVAAIVACASTIEERRDYILAHPHGWVEVSLEYSEIPQVPSAAKEGGDPDRPDSCSLEVRIDREPFVYGSTYPVGDAPPYSIKSGFRFPVPVGPARIEVRYAGCDVAAQKPSSVTARSEITVEEDRVTEVSFDGARLVAQPTRENSVVTLEDIYNAVTGGPKTNP